MANTTRRLPEPSSLLPHDFLSALTLSTLFQPKVIITLLASYTLLARLLRYRIRSFNSSTLPASVPLSSMTVSQAQIIIRRISSQEFPLIFKSALQFALFRTYGIPSISRLLVDTSLFLKPETASKRYVDTTALVSEMMVRDIGTSEWTQGLARLNCIHGKYVLAGRISNEDFLYTLALFAAEPVKFIDRYEWRRVTEVEKCAVGVFWKTVGDAMEIEMRGLPTSDRGETWKSGLHWYEELVAWAEEYERRNMVFDPANKLVAEQTTEILLYGVPRAWHPLGKQVVATFMDRRLRTAMAQEDPPEGVARWTNRAIELRRFCLRYLALPKPYALRFRVITDEKNSQGAHQMNEFDALPYYVKPNLMNRWGPGAWVRRIRGQPVPGDDGDRYYPGGYHLTTLGPPHGKLGQAEAEKKVAPIGERRCPMAFA
ncbi:MAG: hypothetical protein MMC23_005187 [Stictis urceolatum]|nr:hypothetical protein [Stictis urceolata]